ncbi:MAG: FMN-binding glutamate synthase family protein [Sphingobacteriales bacterium]|nr:MAG: FMN-binding glutamate synthase family protein [Sphingobacteriales bacterium]
MSRDLNRVSAKSIILSGVFALNVTVLLAALLIDSNWLWAFSFTLSLTILAIYNTQQHRHTILRNYPLLGYLRYLFESIRPEMRQYFWESDLDGKPFNRRQRSIVYQRAKNERQTVPFGMQDDPKLPGHEWVAHAMFPVQVAEKDLRVLIGNRLCRQPYKASILNIGAMSYGALSKTAISALNEGAALGGFAHNTGEGGISNYHRRGGDLIWQIGTGYFGSRDAEGKFCPELFQLRAAQQDVKMIELKLSQGAKPGHGGILPAAKNTAEIANIRNVMPGTTVYSPPAHSAFSNPVELVQFVGFLRDLSEGKPVGIKMCIGDKQDFVDICNAMVVTRIVPDFITIDGAEGGTGAAPLEFTDSIGMPLYEALAFVTQTLELFNLKKEIKIIAAGRIITAFDILKVLALGADLCYSARGMMLSMGCIQALKCDSGECPVGIATQNRSLYKGLSLTDKRARVASFHENTIHAVVEMMEACGFRSLKDVQASRFFRKVDTLRTRSFQEIYFTHIDDRLRDNWLKASMLN